MLLFQVCPSSKEISEKPLLENNSALIEIYYFFGINKKKYNEEQLIKYIQTNKKYKFLVDFYFYKDRHDFNHFYSWFHKNLNNYVSIKKKQLL